MGQINTNNYPAVDSLLDADLLIVENATHGTGTTTPKQLRENAIGTDPLQTTAQTVTGAINEIFEMATDTVVGLELGKMTSFSDGVIVTDIDLHRAPVAGDRILFYHNTAVASPSSLTTYNDGVAVTTTIGDFSMTHPAGLTLMKCIELGESLRWQTVQDIASGYTAGIGISINGTTINNSAPQLGDDIAYSKIETVTSGALGYFNADADCLVMDFRTDAEPYNGGYTLRLTTTGASFKYAVLKDKAGNNYAEEIPSGSLVLCKSNVSGTGSEADPVVVTVLEIGNAEMAHDVEVLKDICITEKTVSGNPVIVTDALPYNAESVVADIELIQNLNGYDHPWVGGAGKNKYVGSPSFDGYVNPRNTWVKQTETYNGHEVYKKSGEAWSGIYKRFYLPVGTYTFSVAVKTSGNGDGVALFTVLNTDEERAIGNDLNKNTTATNSWTVISNTFTITTAGYVCPRIEKTEGTGDIYISEYQLEAGNTATSYAPYSNICPISGRTAVVVDDVGKNKVPMTVSNIKALNTSGTWTGNVYTVNNTTIEILTDAANNVTGIKTNTGSGGASGLIIFKLSDSTLSVKTGDIMTGCPTGGATNKYMLNINGTPFSDTGSGGTCAADATGTLNLDIFAGATLSNALWYPMIRDASAPSGFVPYAHSSATIQLGQTVYGGSLNVTTGVMTINTVTKTYTGEADEMWDGDLSINSYWSTATIGNKAKGDIICNEFKGVKVNTWNDLHDNEIALHPTVSNSLRVKYSGVANLTAFRAFLASNPMQVCYELATPQTIQLTPEQLEMLKGYNRLSSDGGGDITLIYKADRLAAIEAALAALQ